MSDMPILIMQDNDDGKILKTVHFSQYGEHMLEYIKNLEFFENIILENLNFKPVYTIKEKLYFLDENKVVLKLKFKYFYPNDEEKLK